MRMLVFAVVNLQTKFEVAGFASSRDSTRALKLKDVSRDHECAHRRWL